jgi:predicted ATPase/class 3 adenylate cyclase
MSGFFIAMGCDLLYSRFNQQTFNRETTPMSTSLPTGTVTFLFTDIEGSTKLAQAHSDNWESLRARHHAILQSAIEAHNGYVFQIIGDAFCAAFHTAGDSLKAAITAQRALQQTSDVPETDVPETSEVLAVRVRMGIHTGKAELQEGGDYSGYLTLSRVQRLMSAGHGGQTLISLATQELVRDELPLSVTLRDMGEHRLKDLTYPEHIYQANAPDLPSIFPTLKTLDAQLTNLPTQLTPFVGREREIAAVLGLLRNPDVHLVTLTGAGGTGKTRLSLQVAAEILDEFEHGVWFVELASITNPELVLPTIASTLKVKEVTGTTIEQSLQDYLHNKHMLLAVDNFEQVVSAGPTMTRLLRASPKIKIMISSREVLRVRGEHDYPVPPLGLPETKRKQTAAVLAQYEAIALFVQHAQAANPSFILDEDNASTVADICSRLDGLPLALELAAARSRLLKPTVMLEKLKIRLDTLTSGARDLPRRQQTIRGAIDWSYDLLNDSEKVFFARLGIFVGGWNLESAEAVCGKGLNVNILNGLESLLDKSLIRQTEGRSGEMRFTMLETIREYACEKLSQRAEIQSVRQAHSDSISALLEKARVAAGSSEEATWFVRLDDELDNLRAAVEFTFENKQPRLAMQAGRLNLYWEERVNIHEPLNWLERAMEMQADVPPLEKAHAFNSAGNLYHELGDMPHAKMYYESALPLFQSEHDGNGLSRVLNNLGNMGFAEKNYEKARQFYEESLTYEKTDSWGVIMTLINLGSLAKLSGDWEQSREYYLHARDVGERLDSETGIAAATLFLATLDLAVRKLDEARKGFERGLQAAAYRANPFYVTIGEGFFAYIDLLMVKEKDVRQRLGQALEASAEFLNQSPNLPSPWLLIEGQARLDVMDGHMGRAAQLFGASWTQRDVDASPLNEFERPDYEACINTIRAGMGDEIFNQLFEKGKAMTLKDAIALALDASAS